MKRSLVHRPFPFTAILLGIGASAALPQGWAAEFVSPVVWSRPAVVTPGNDGSPPSDAVVLFDGKDMSQWKDAEKWIVKDGYVEAGGKSIASKRAFGNCQVHLEWASPEKVVGSGQGRGNSGLYMMAMYEIQILDSYENETYFDGQAAAVYKQHPPLVNACRKPGQWQSYDVIWDVPKFDAKGKLLKPAYVTVLHNGVVVQNHFAVEGRTGLLQGPVYLPHPARMPIVLQYHNNPVRFRNIWVRELQEIKSRPAAPQPTK
jgi:hypothetical protein